MNLVAGAAYDRADLEPVQDDNATDQPMTHEGFGYREALAVVSADLRRRERALSEAARAQRARQIASRSMLLDHRGLALI